MSAGFGLNASIDYALQMQLVQPINLSLMP